MKRSVWIYFLWEVALAACISISMKQKCGLQVVCGDGERHWTSSSVSFYLFTIQVVHNGGETECPFCISHSSIPLTSWSNFKFFHCIIISLLSVALLEKKADDKLRQYSLEGETHLPGVLGVHAIALLQQHEGLWSHGLQIKYGLLGTLKNREKNILYCSFFLQDLPLCLEHSRKISVNF